MNEIAAPNLVEYVNNQFIVGLPPVLSQLQLREKLRRRPAFHVSERDYPAALRKHCVLRLARCFEPLSRQLQLAERLDMLIRQGYLGRNPKTHGYMAHLQAGAERVEARDLNAFTSTETECTAWSFALLGCSGSGKSLTMNSVLRLYPEVIDHAEPFSLKQIVWMKLECPIRGSPRQLCIAFFKHVDRLIGTRYFKQFAGRGVGTDEMLTHVAQVAHLHAIGVLVVDEIQNLRRASVGAEELLNFFVALINTIGIPIVLVGTLGAVPLLQGNFRDARRGSGVGSAIWDRMSPGPEWDYFIEQLWQFQWTRELAELTPEIKKVLYEESQGIPDIVVKLLVLAQLRIIGIAEVKNTPELLTAALLRRVAREDFKLVHPMLAALRRNDESALAKYDDLAPLQKYVTDTITVALGGDNTFSTYAPADSGSAAAPMDDMSGMLLRSLTTIGVAEDVAALLVADVVAKNSSSDPLLLLSMATERLKKTPVQTVGASAPQQPKPAKETEVPADDLRQMVAMARPSGQSGYHALLAAGLIRSPQFEGAA